MNPPLDDPPAAPSGGRLARLAGRRGASGRPLWLALVAAVVVGLAVLAVMRQQETRNEQVSDPAAPSGLVMPDQGRATALAAVGLLRGVDKPCTAWVVATGPAVTAMAGMDAQTGSPAPSSATGAQFGNWAEAMPDSPAFAVTTGRCLGLADANTVVSDRGLSEVSLGVNAFASLTSSVASPITWVPVAEVVWASARWIDLAVLQLGVSYAELAASGVLPVEAVAPVSPGEQVLAAGIPIGGIAADQQYLRVTRCAAGDQVGVLESGMFWSPAQSSDCGGFRLGSAGSPLFNPSGQAVGMLTTSTVGARGLEPGEGDCGVGRACEVTAENVSFQSGRSYLQPVVDLAPCLASGSFLLGGQCALEQPGGVVPATADPPAGRPGATVLLTLGQVPTGVRAAAHAAGDLAGTDCFSRSGWSRPRPVRNWELRLELPSSPGWMLACIGSAQQPTPVVVEVDARAPDATTAVLRIVEIPGGREVVPVPAPPHLVAFLWTSGPQGMDCAAAEGYTKFRGVPAVIQADDLPATVCLIAVDQAGNRSDPVAREVR